MMARVSPGSQSNFFDFDASGMAAALAAHRVVVEVVLGLMGEQNKDGRPVHVSRTCSLEMSGVQLRCCDLGTLGRIMDAGSGGR